LLNTQFREGGESASERERECKCEREKKICVVSGRHGCSLNTIHYPKTKTFTELLFFSTSVIQIFL
jgi:hypothetical protein